MMTQGIVAVDIGGSHITSVMIKDLHDATLASPFRYAKVDSTGDLESIINQWSDSIKMTVEEATIGFDNKIAIAIPGPFDYENGVGLYKRGKKFGALKDANIKDLLMNTFAAPIEIHFQNDAACFGLGESHFGKTRNYKRSMAITLGTGIGCTFINKGKVVKTGATVPYGGEIYHLPFGQSVADDYFSTRWFVKTAKEEYGVNITGVRELVQLKQQIDVKTIFATFARQLYDFLLPLALNFGTEAIVFGGNISKAWHYFENDLVSHFQKSNIRVCKSELNDQAICLGAAQSFLKNV